DKRVDVNAGDGIAEASPMHCAVRFEETKARREIVAMIAGCGRWEAGTRDACGRTAEMVARDQGHVETVRLMNLQSVASESKSTVRKTAWVDKQPVKTQGRIRERRVMDVA